MNSRIFLRVVSGGILLLWSWSADQAAAKDAPRNPSGFYVANWNVENLFDTDDDPRNRGDNEFLPNNPTTRWTRARFKTKIANLAKVISSMNHGAGPDLLGLEEVENKAVLKALAQKLPEKNYGIVHEDSPDPRGIDTALLYNRDLFTLVYSRAHDVSLRWRRDTRDILHATFKDRNDKLLHVFVNHWPSRGGGAKASDPDRFSAARTLSRALDYVFQRDRAAHVIVLGDFNDEPSSRSIRVVLDVKPYPSRSGYVDTQLYNLTSRSSGRGMGTYFHSYRGSREWRMYDQIMVSGALINSSRIEYDPDSLRIDRPDYMVQKKGRKKGAPVPTFQHQEHYRGGYSDHLPVGARFTFHK